MTAPSRFGSGLVVGKFSPLHRGHEHLLKTAIARCERVFCLTYSSPELGGCSAAARRLWLAELEPNVVHLALDEAELARLRSEHGPLPRLPHNDAPELEHRTFVAELCLRVLGVAVEAVFTSEHYGDGFAAELSQQFRAAGHALAQVEHVLVDLERRSVPISASAIRADHELMWDYLSPVVRASFVKRVCSLGGESTGKTTLTRGLARRFETSHVEEYGRELWIERGGQLGYDDFLRIGRTQVEHEAAAARTARHVLFGDTSPLTTLFYCLDQFGTAEPELHALAQRSYDLVLLCSPDIPFVQDGTRRDAAFRARQHDFYVRELNERRAPFIQLDGSPETRLAQASEAVAGLWLEAPTV